MRFTMLGNSEFILQCTQALLDISANVCSLVAEPPSCSLVAEPPAGDQDDLPPVAVGRGRSGSLVDRRP